MNNSVTLLSNHVSRIRSLVDDRELVAANRLHLVETTTRLFRARGYHNTSTRDIARAAGMSVGAIYQYVRHKEDLVFLILQTLVYTYEEQIYPLTEVAGPARERLRQMVGTYYGILDKHHAKADLLYRQVALLSPTVRRYFSDSEEQLNARIRQVIEIGVAEGSFRPVNTQFVVHNIVSMGHMWALKRSRFKDTMTLDDYIEQQFMLLDAVLGAERSP